MTFDQDKRESDFLKSQKDPDRVRRDIREGDAKKAAGKSSVNREENDEKI